MAKVKRNNYFENSPSKEKINSSYKIKKFRRSYNTKKK